MRVSGACPQFATNDLVRGFVLARVATNEFHSFDPPENAIVCERWRRTGSATGWIPVSPSTSDWAFPVGTNLAARFRVFAFGRIDPVVDGAVSTNFAFWPLSATMGLVPAVNWPLLPPSARPSQFWSAVTPSNTLQLTWQNALLGRTTNAPVSFQAELFPSGRFDYRYDLSRIAAQGGASRPGEPQGGGGLPSAVVANGGLETAAPLADTDDPVASISAPSAVTARPAASPHLALPPDGASVAELRAARTVALDALDVRRERFEPDDSPESAALLAAVSAFSPSAASIPSRTARFRRISRSGR